MSKLEILFNGHKTVFKAETDLELMDQVIAACEEEKEGINLLSALQETFDLNK